MARIRQLKWSDIKPDDQDITFNSKSQELRTKDYGKEKKLYLLYVGKWGKWNGQWSRGTFKDPFSYLVVLKGCWCLWVWELCRTDLEPWHMCGIWAYRRKDYFLIFRKETSVFHLNWCNYLENSISKVHFYFFYSWHFNITNSHCRCLFHGGPCCKSAWQQIWHDIIKAIVEDMRWYTFNSFSFFLSFLNLGSYKNFALQE